MRNIMVIALSKLPCAQLIMPSLLFLMMAGTLFAAPLVNCLLTCSLLYYELQLATIQGVSFDGLNFHSFKLNCESFPAEVYKCISTTYRIFLVDSKSFTANMFGKPLPRKFCPSKLTPYMVYTRMSMVSYTRLKAASLIHPHTGV